MEYGERLKELRNKRELSQQELADRLQINRSTYARYELGRTQPDFITLQKLANFFDVSIDYLLGRTDKPQVSSKTSLMDDIPEDLRELFADPELQIAFRDIPGTYEEKKKEIIDLLRFIKFKEAGRKPGDKQGE